MDISLGMDAMLYFRKLADAAFDREETMELIRQLRAAVPGIHIRTTLMVGFPGE